MLGERARSAVNRAAAGAANVGVLRRAVRRWAESRIPTTARRVLFVCKGNICRSPYAEFAARRAFGEGRGWEFLSAGLEATSGARPPDAAVRVGSERSIDLSRHEARTLAEIPPYWADAVFVMEPLQVVDRGLESYRRRCRVLPLGVVTGAALIADPYGQGDAVFRACFDEIDAAITAFRCLGGRAE